MPDIEAVAHRGTPVVRHVEVVGGVTLLVVNHVLLVQRLNLVTHLNGDQWLGIGALGTYQQRKCRREVGAAVDHLVNK